MIDIKIDNDIYLVDIIIKPKNRRIYLRIKDGIIVITTPYKLSEAFIKKMIIKSKKAIDEALIKKDDVKSNNIHFLGKEYKVNISLAKHNYIFIDNDEFLIYTKKLDDIHIKKIINEYYNNALKKIVDANYIEIKQKFHIDYDVTFSYKDVKTYFGECYPKRKHIILASKLAKYDYNYILSVIYHEFAHFFYLNHSNSFYNLLEMLFPNYKKIQKSLRMIKYKDIY